MRLEKLFPACFHGCRSPESMGLLCQEDWHPLPLSLHHVRSSWSWRLNIQGWPSQREENTCLWQRGSVSERGKCLVSLVSFLHYTTSSPASHAKSHELEKVGELKGLRVQSMKRWSSSPVHSGPVSVQDGQMYFRLLQGVNSSSKYPFRISF